MIKELIKKMRIEAEEYAELHNEDCSCLMEEPDACDCAKMGQIENIIKDTVKEVVETLSYDIAESEEQRKAIVKLYLNQ